MRTSDKTHFHTTQRIHLWHSKCLTWMSYSWHVSREFIHMWQEYFARDIVIYMCHDSQQLEAQQQSRCVGARHGATPGPAAASAHKSYVNESRHMCISCVTCTSIMSHINELCQIYLVLLQRHISMSYVTYECVMSHMNASCHIWMHHVIYEWVMSHMTESCHISMSHVTYGCVMSHIPCASSSTSAHNCFMWMSHVKFMHKLHATHMQHTATHCNTLQHTATHCNTLQHTTTHWSTLQRAATHCKCMHKLHVCLHMHACMLVRIIHMRRTATTATHCNALQRAATLCNALQRTATRCNTLQLVRLFTWTSCSVLDSHEYHA